MEEFHKNLDQLLKDLYIYIDLQTTSEIFKLNYNTITFKNPNQNQLEDYLKSKGYLQDRILNRHCFIKGFVCVLITDSFIEIWHDLPNSKSLFITMSQLTGLPIALEYMEKI